MSEHAMNRRRLFSGSFGATLALAGASLPVGALAGADIRRNQGTALRYSLNAYSFNAPLRSGEITLPELIDYCASLNFSGLDATGYYFPGYPATPDDDYVYDLKKKAALNGMTISGTGVKNDFAVADQARRKEDVQLVKDWIEVAEKLGAPVIRVFSGRKTTPGFSREQVLEWMVPDIAECVEHGKNHGVMVGLQHHHDFLETADQTIELINAVDSEWFGVILDTGSLRTLDPYEEIARLLPYAVSWQVKELIWQEGVAGPIDLAKLKAIIDQGGYRGFLPIETLGEGDPKVKVKNLMEQIRRHMGDQ